jgi:hypothetical protein
MIEALMRDGSARETIRIRTFCAPHTHAVRIRKMENRARIVQRENRRPVRRSFLEEGGCS